MIEWKLEFPPDVQAEREPVLAAQIRAMNEGTMEAVREAQELALAWLARHPEDLVMWDAGEPVAMLADALAIMETKGIAPLERTDWLPAECLTV